MTIRIIVAGAKGKMGSETVKMIAQDNGLQLVCGVDPRSRGEDVGEILGLGPLGAPLVNDIEEALRTYQADVLIDFTTPETVYQHAVLALEHRVRPVIGTTGLTDDELSQLSSLAEENQLGAVVAPNFAVGAILMMKCAEMAVKYFPDVEIIEMHHDQKLDAPSGTAIKTAELISKVREERKQGHPEEKEVIDGARGAFYQGFPIHSVRLPGLIAHQQVIFGGEGETLTIRHDSIHRSSFMPGVKLAVKKVVKLDRLVYGLDNLLD